MQRIRLLIDVALTDRQVEWLQDMIGDQPIITVELLPPINMLGGRLVGAQPVAIDE